MKKIGHHYITESYQRNFSNEKGQVWVLMPSDDILCTNPENLFKENHFYTVSIPTGGATLFVEDTLAEIEGRFNTVVKNKIEKRLKLSDEDRVDIAAFISAMLGRTKIDRE